MKRLLLALVSLLFASSAYAAPITYAFFQGGYDEGAFVAGFFVADKGNDSFVGHVTYEYDLQCAGCEVLDYRMIFSGNSHVPSFTHVGLESFHLREGADIDNWGGILWDTRSSLLPAGNNIPDGCDAGFPPEEGGCTSIPVGLMESDNWLVTPDDFDDRFHWQAGDLQPGTLDICNPICGRISHRSFGFTATTQRVHIFQVPEPASLSLLGLALAGLAVIRRRKQ